jgi:hypothetical protein
MTTRKGFNNQTPEERKANLERGNRIRLQRAEDKRLIRLRKLKAQDIVRDQPEQWANARVAELLVSVPGIARRRADEYLRKSNATPMTRLQGLSDRQRAILVEALDERDTSPYARRKARQEA